MRKYWINKIKCEINRINYEINTINCKYDYIWNWFVFEYICAKYINSISDPVDRFHHVMYCIIKVLKQISGSVFNSAVLMSEFQDVIGQGRFCNFLPTNHNQNIKVFWPCFWFGTKLLLCVCSWQTWCILHCYCTMQNEFNWSHQSRPKKQEDLLFKMTQLLTLVIFKSPNLIMIHQKVLLHLPNRIEATILL